MRRRMLTQSALTLPLAVTSSALLAGALAAAGPPAAATAGSGTDQYAAQGRVAASDPSYMIAVGDIPTCGKGYPNPSPTALATGTLALSIKKAHSSLNFMGLGDQLNPFTTATFPEFMNCYAKTGWGSLKSVTHPSPGNHEQGPTDPNATGYFKYFGGAAGSAAKPYYSFDFGTWHFISLDSECQFVPGGVGGDGCASGSKQEIFLRNDLAAFRSQHPHRCILAYWHRPLFSSSTQAPSTLTHFYANPQVLPLWQDLYFYRAAIVLNGHYHGYERFAPQKWDGTFENIRGIRQFVVATGGATFYKFQPTHASHSQVRITDTPGVLQLTLNGDSYDWAFYSTTSSKPLDSGVNHTCPQPGS